MATIILATLSDICRQRYAQQLMNGYGFIVESFAVGSGGHDPANPTNALAPDPTLTSLPLQSFGPKALYKKELISLFSPRFTGVLEASEAIGPLSNVALYARMIYTPLPTDPFTNNPADPLYNTTFLFALGNYPLRTKTSGEILEIIITIQY